MKRSTDRLTALTPTEIAQLQSRADDLADLQAFLNRLPSGLLVEQLSSDELDRLRELARSPQEKLCGPEILAWHNASRRPVSELLKPSAL